MKTVTKLWFDNERIFLENTSGKICSQPMRFYPRLLQASEEQRAAWTESYFGLHWENIDEDISFESFTWNDNDPLTLYHQT
ncbi:MAG: DUF2442 domain-containing protein [Lentimicrobiaceae bacterium]|nr:DUF2442 domain-containing protein [Lentimicrobiaceae bacterium]